LGWNNPSDFCGICECETGPTKTNIPQELWEVRKGDFLHQLLLGGAVDWYISSEDVSSEKK
jgi:hypothetical protein